MISISIAFAVVLGEAGIRTWKSSQNNSHTAEPKPAVKGPKNDTSEKAGGNSGKNAHFALMRFSSYLGYYPLESNSGRGYHSNNLGFRYDDEFPAEKPEGELRIFVTGGSTAWGVGPSQKNFYAPVAEKILRERFPDKSIRIVSAGVSAYLSTHERILIANKIRRMQPNMVIMFSGWNDIYAGYTGKRVVDDTWDYLKVAPILAEHSPRFSQDIPKIEVKQSAPEYDSYQVKSRYVIDTFLYTNQAATQHFVPPDVVLEDLQDNIRAIVDVSRRANFNFVFYLQPSLYNTKKVLTKPESLLLAVNRKKYKNFAEYNSKIYDRYREALPALAEVEGIEFVDSDVAIASEQKSVFNDHVHFGDRGNRLLGNHLADIVSRFIAAEKE